jgi:hypothetical protein
MQHALPSPTGNAVRIPFTFLLQQTNMTDQKVQHKYLALGKFPLIARAARSLHLPEPVSYIVLDGGASC